MFSAVLRSAVPSLRSFGNFLGFRAQSPLSLMGGGLREKSCLKTNKSASKRFIVRGGGRIKRGKGGRSHNTGHKGRARVNRLAASAPITEKSIEERMRVIIRANC